MNGEKLTLHLGKVSNDILKRIVYPRLGATRGDVLQGPAIGEDAAVVRLGRRLLAVTSDPVTGSVDNAGWLAVHINANDLAAKGVKPCWFLSNLLLPPNTSRNLIRKICGQIDRAAKELNLAVVGGHSEVTSGLPRPIVVGCAIGAVEGGRYVRSGGANPGDVIILSKSAGIEGTAILASERRDVLSRVLGSQLVRAAIGYFRLVSVVREALAAFNTGGVTAMHDPTEGGIIGGLRELADASNTGLKTFEERIPIGYETARICDFFEIDPLQLISSGSLIITSPRGASLKIIKSLSRLGVAASVIGEVTGSPRSRLVVKRDGSVEPLPRPMGDHLWKALERPVAADV